MTSRQGVILMATDDKNDLFEAFKRFDTTKFKVPSMEAHMDMVKALQKIHYDTFQSVMKLQNEYLKRLAEEWKELAKYSVSSEPLNKKAEAQGKAIKETIEKSMDQLKKVGEVIQKNQKEALDKIKGAAQPKAASVKPKKTAKPKKK